MGSKHTVREKLRHNIFFAQAPFPIFWQKNLLTRNLIAKQISQTFILFQ